MPETQEQFQVRRYDVVSSLSLSRSFISVVRVLTENRHRGDEGIRNDEHHVVGECAVEDKSQRCGELSDE